jgi:hypothetical protein
MDHIERVIHVPPPPNAEQFRRRINEEHSFLRRNFGKLLRLYPEQFVMVYRDKVRGHSPNLMDMVGLLDRKKFPRERVLVKYISDDPLKLFH